MTGVDKLHARNLTGKGVRVAIVDGGLDYLHPALGAGFGPGYRVEYGWDFVGDNVKPPNKAQPDNDPFGDCSNHATHTAGILFANDGEGNTGFKGVAPGVTVEHYRVFDCNGMSTGNVVVDAVNKAYERGVDIINLSLGSGSRPFSDDPLSTLVSRINREGKTFIVTVSGNSGHAGTFGAAAPEGGGDDLFGVGSVDAAYKYSVYQPATIIVDGAFSKDLSYNPETWTAHRRSEFPARVEVLALSGNSTSDSDGCTGVNNSRLPRDALVLLQRGGCTLKTKMENLARAGVKYTLIYNNVDGPAFDLEVRLDEGLQIEGAASLTKADGEDLLSLLAKGHKVEVEMDSNFTRQPILSSTPNTKTGGKVSTFTTWGPSGEGKLLTSVLAPGGGILSTFPRKNGGFGIQSGSSMAVPYVAGVLALLGEAHPDVPIKQLASVLAMTARPLKFNDGTNRSYEFLSSPWQQGSGLIDASAALAVLNSGVKTSTTRLAFNDTEFGQKTLSLHLRNEIPARITYDISVAQGPGLLALNETTRAPVPFAAAVRAAEAAAEFLATVRPDLQANVTTSLNRLVLDPGQETDIEVTVDTTSLGPLEQRCPLYGGWVHLTSSSGPNDHSLSIPYAGIGCRIKYNEVLDPAFTYLSSATRNDVETARFWNRKLEPIDQGHVFKLHKDRRPFDPANPDKERFSSETLPALQIQLQMDTRGIRAELLPVGGGKPVEIFPPEIGSRVGGWGRVETVHLVWDGRLPNGSFTDSGNYVVRIRTLRLFGDERKEADWRDEVISSKFRLEYEGQLINIDSPDHAGLIEILPCF
ncbi:serine endopeptidase [Colletotrichum sojae]|uniref:Serine endopeptidase n=1 Tax=Colletotrichum sojae TaxID=2175907 RepID=A0A8H6J4M8_9PEZI|nr:serine endopeptidase [Colletotrichum sojae]